MSTSPAPRLDTAELAQRVADVFTGGELMQRLRAGQLGVELYRTYLRAMFHFVESSSATLARAAACVDSSVLREYLWHHAVEERGHERQIADDLRALGDDPDALAGSLPVPICQAYVSYFRTAGEYAHPAERLGAVLAIESLGKRLGADVHAALQGGGIPREATSFLRAHGVADVAHADHVVAAVEQHAAELAAHVRRGAEIATQLYVELHDGAAAPAGPLCRPFEPPAAPLTTAALLARAEELCQVGLTELGRVAPMMRALTGGGLTREVYADYLVRAFHWLDHSPATLAALAEAPGLRWPALRDWLWQHSATKRSRFAIAEDLTDLGLDGAALLAAEPDRSTRVFIAYLHDTSSRAPLQRLGLMLFIERLQSRTPPVLTGAIRAMLGLPDGRGTQFLDQILALHRQTGTELWDRMPGLDDLTGAEQGQLLYGCVVGGYLYARMVRGDDGVVW